MPRSMPMAVFFAMPLPFLSGSEMSFKAANGRRDPRREARAFRNPKTERVGAARGGPRRQRVCGSCSHGLSRKFYQLSPGCCFFSGGSVFIILHQAPPFPSSANDRAQWGCQVGNIPGVSPQVLPPCFLGPISALDATPPRTLQTLLGFAETGILRGGGEGMKGPPTQSLVSWRPASQVVWSRLERSALGL